MYTSSSNAWNFREDLLRYVLGELEYVYEIA